MYTEKTKEVIKIENDVKEWVKNLNSGKYKQGTHLLRDKRDNFCCLGVLCDIAIQRDKNISWLLDEKQGDCYRFGLYGDFESFDFGEDHEPTKELSNMRKLLKLHFVPSNPNFGVDKLIPEYYQHIGRNVDDLAEFMNFLMSLNDSGLYNFSEIAKIIEHIAPKLIEFNDFRFK